MEQQMGEERVELRSVPDLQRRVFDVASGLVTFDGDLHAGKTTLARKIGEALGHPVLDLDGYLLREQGNFVNALRITELTRDIGKALDSSSVVLLSGVCMLRVLEIAKLDTSLSIYVRRLSPMGIPNDLDTTDAENGKPFDDDPDIPAIFREIHVYGVAPRI
ncbi:hypothetical protein CY652_17810 [Burkholderia sp. WAC0059]|uniref:hypothetical protein n=1 Tax=Burkholderia sp. WAC0059 TaxID=2066022 RepID=UPI000C7EA312|nr:hypothetical protein [Burkholderia sp. WAC0059]PLZ01138.1 hypothetical protein CY652_17810 [Burkholderia sp. WAC0059]